MLGVTDRNLRSIAYGAYNMLIFIKTCKMGGPEKGRVVSEWKCLSTFTSRVRWTRTRTKSDTDVRIRVRLRRGLGQELKLKPRTRTRTRTNHRSRLQVVLSMISPNGIYVRGTKKAASKCRILKRDFEKRNAKSSLRRLTHTQPFKKVL